MEEEARDPLTFYELSETALLRFQWSFFKLFQRVARRREARREVGSRDERVARGNTFSRGFEGSGAERVASRRVASGCRSNQRKSNNFYVIHRGRPHFDQHSFHLPCYPSNAKTRYTLPSKPTLITFSNCCRNEVTASIILSSRASQTFMTLRYRFAKKLLQRKLYRSFNCFR